MQPRILDQVEDTEDFGGRILSPLLSGDHDRREKQTTSDWSAPASVTVFFIQ